MTYFSGLFDRSEVFDDLCLHKTALTAPAANLKFNKTSTRGNSQENLLNS